MAVDPRGGQKHSVNQSPYGGSDYPLTGPAPVSGYSNLNELLSDLWFGHVRDSDVRPLSIKWMYGFGSGGPASPIVPTHAQDLLLVDGDGATVLDTRTATSFSSNDWGGWLRVLEWRFAKEVLRLVHIVDWPADVTPPTYPVYFEPEDAELDNRVIQRIPKGVSSITVDGTTLASTSVVLRGRYNTVISAGSEAAPDGGARETQITFDNFPGEGAGRYGPTCEDLLLEAPLHVLGGVTADSRGNVQIRTDSCLRVEPVVTVVGAAVDGLRAVTIRAGALRIQDDCEPCYDCDDFIAIYEATRKLRDRLAELVQRAAEAQAQYEEGLARFEKQRNCREGLSLRVNQEAYCPCRLGIAIGFCNPRDTCIEGLIIPISFEYTDDDGCDAACDSTPEFGRILPNSTFRGGFVQDNRNIPRVSYMLNGAWPHYWAYFPKVQPHQQAFVTFMLEFENCSSADRVETMADAYEVSGVTGGSDGLPPIPDYTPGVGPTGAALELRVASCAVRAFTALRPVCE